MKAPLLCVPLFAVLLAWSVPAQTPPSDPPVGLGKGTSTYGSDVWTSDYEKLLNVFRLPWTHGSEPDPKDAQDFVYLGPTRPVLYRLYVQVEGRSLSAVWLNCIKRIYRYLDVDRDGTISKKEAERLPPPQLLFNSFFFGDVYVSQASLKPGTDGKITLRELAEHYRQAGGPAFQLSYGVNSNVFFEGFGGPRNMAVSADSINKAIFTLLDTNKDGKLTKDELHKGVETLLAQDNDEDELITTQELLANISPQQRAAIVVGKIEDGPAGKGAFVPFAAADGQQIADLLLARYGKPGEKRLSRKQLGIESTSTPSERKTFYHPLAVDSFNELDKNGDGFLDRDELTRFGQRQAEVEILIRLKVQNNPRDFDGPFLEPPEIELKKEVEEKKKVEEPAKKSDDKDPPPAPPAQGEGKEPTPPQKADDKKVEDDKKVPPVPTMNPKGKVDMTPKEPSLELIVRRGKPSPLAGKIKKAGSPSTGRETVTLDLGPSTLELSVDVNGRFGGFGGDFAIPKDAYIQQLNEADKDNNGYLDEKEAKRNPLFMNLFKLMDADGDGMLYPKELAAYLERMQELQTSAGASCASMTITDTGRGIFDLIDANKDGKLTIRELRQMVESFKSLDKNGDGFISLDELPRKYNLQVRHGPNRLGFDSVYFEDVAMSPSKQAPTPSNGPVWFRKMDKNNDGDVSRREFLGTDHEFRRLDADNDGLISLAEATRFEEELRKGETQKK